MPPPAADQWGDLDAAAASAAPGTPDQWRDLEIAAAHAAMTHTVSGSQSVPPWFNNDPASGMSGPARFAAGLSAGAVNVGQHLGNLVGLVSPGDMAATRAQNAPLLATPGGAAGNFTAESLPFAALGAATGGLGDAGAGAGLLARSGALLGRAAASPMGQGAIQGGVMADPGQKLQGVTYGGLSGAVLPALGYLGSKSLSGATRTPEAQALLDAGVDVPPWQLNPKGVFGRTAQALEAVPGVGDVVKNANTGAVQGYVKAFAQRAMPPGTTLDPALTSVGDMVKDAAGKYQVAYGAAEGYPVSTAPVAQGLAQVGAKARPGLSAPERTAAVQNLQDLLSEHLDQAQQAGKPLGQIDSANLLDFRSQVRDLIRGEPGDTNASRATRALYQDAERQVTGVLNQQLPPKVSAGLQATDAQYARFAILRNASAASKDNPDGPSPYQIATAISQATNKNQYAQGGGLGRDLSKAAVATFKQDQPKTGLTGWGRLGLPLMIATQTPWGHEAMSAAMSHPLFSVPPLLAAGAAMTPLGRRAIAGQIPLQQSLARGVQALSNGIPAGARDLAFQAGRAGVTNSLTDRLEQDPASSADAFLRQLDQVEAARQATQNR